MSNEDQARFAQLIEDSRAPAGGDAHAAPKENPEQPVGPPKPTVGRVVLYHSKKGDGIVSPAMVLRTRDTTNLDVIDRWGKKPDGTSSGVPRPAELVAELPDDETVDLVVHGLGGDYREYAVPFAFPTPASEAPDTDSEAAESIAATPGTWSWPPRV